MQPDTRIRTSTDLIGGRFFWASALATLASLVACIFVRSERAWIGLGVLSIWTAFSLVNAIRSHRVHSIVSAPVYFAAAVVVFGAAMGRIDVQAWMIWVLCGGILAANLGERIFGRYL
jgi:hypothetical protein